MSLVRIAVIGNDRKMKIMSYNPGHDGAIAVLQDAHLQSLFEVEKDSNFRHSGVAVHDLWSVFADLEDVPDVLCEGGWLPRDFDRAEKCTTAGYRGVSKHESIIGHKRLLGRNVEYFSSSHERSHLLCAYGMSNLPKGAPCYALVWEGSIGAFYEIDRDLNITLLREVLPEPGHRYAMLYGLADTTFEKNLGYSRISDAGKLMALASFSNRRRSTNEEEALIGYLLQDCRHLDPRAAYAGLKKSCYYNIGLDNSEFRHFVGIFSDRIFERFHHFADRNMRKGLPLLIAGGCGLNCDWNTKWKESGLFPEVFVPPVPNDSGSAIGTAIDAQLHYTGNPKIGWDVYSGREFDTTASFDVTHFDTFDASDEVVADMLANDLVLGWVNGRYEIGPRALGNRSIVAAPFSERMRQRLNDIKQREQFRPIAPVCLEEEAAKLFKCVEPSPYMLYTFRTTGDALAAVTHVDKSARLQTVSAATNSRLYTLLQAFKVRTGFGVLCNTSLNFNGRGFINSIDDLALYTIRHGLDGFVVNGQGYASRASSVYQVYRRMGGSVADVSHHGENSDSHRPPCP